MDKIKCDKCNKKFGLIVFDCKCKGKFCSLHKYSDTHNCSFDFISEGREEFIKCNPKIAPSKLTVI
jgi:predicted nucleic acid binding AN1-type Zn finger protein